MPPTNAGVAAQPSPHLPPPSHIITVVSHFTNKSLFSYVVSYVDVGLISTTTWALAAASLYK